MVKGPEEMCLNRRDRKATKEVKKLGEHSESTDLQQFKKKNNPWTQMVMHQQRLVDCSL